MDPSAGEGSSSSNNGNTNDTLSVEEFESWTLLDRSPKRSSPSSPAAMDSKEETALRKDRPSEAEEQEEDDEDADEEEEEEQDVDEEAEQNSASEVEEETETGSKTVETRTSGVESVQEKLKPDDSATRDRRRKKRTVSDRSADSHDGFSSDGISVISESGSESRDQQQRGQGKVHFRKDLPRLRPISSEDAFDLDQDTKESTQLSRKISPSDGDQELVPADAIVPWRDINRASVVLLGVVITAIAAILVGNSRIYTSRIEEFNFEHEQRISELELENNILKNEMTKLKHLYTRTELDEEVQKADTEWAKVLEETLTKPQAEPVAEPQAEPETPATEETAEPIDGGAATVDSTARPKDVKSKEPLVFRKVPPQDLDVKHKVVWSGDDGEPILIADKDYVLPDFCYNKNAVQDDLYSEYSSKYCDIKKRKIEAKQRKAEIARKYHKKHQEPKDYTKYIKPTPEEIEQYKREAAAPPPKPPSLSPFEFDFQRAYESIKEEGSVILESLVAILDLDPAPEFVSVPQSSTPVATESGYLADDETATTSSDSSPSVGEEPNLTAQDGVNWDLYPPWVREKYETIPEMHHKLHNKESLLWEWERKKNQFLHEVGLGSLDEVQRTPEDELKQRKQKYHAEKNNKEYEQHKQKHDEWRKYDRSDEHHHKKKYDDRKGSKERYDEPRKEWKEHPRNDRSHEHNDHHHQNGQKEWKKDDKDWKYKNNDREQHREWKNENQSKEYNNSQHKNRNQDQHQNHSDEQSNENDSHLSEYHKDQPKYNADWRESSGERERKQDYKKRDWRESSGERFEDRHDRKDRTVSKESSGYGGHKKHEGKHWKNNDHKHDQRYKDSIETKKNGHTSKESKEYRRKPDDDDYDDDDNSSERFSGEESYFSQYRGEKHKKWLEDDDDDDDDDDFYKKQQQHYRKDKDSHHNHKDKYRGKNDDHWKNKQHHKSGEKRHDHSQEKRR